MIRLRRAITTMTFTNLQAFQGLDSDLRAALLAQIRDLWTHGSTAIEGNTLCHAAYAATRSLVEQAHAQQAKRLR